MGRSRALELEGLVEKVVYTWEYGEEKQKPHPFSFNLMLESLQTEASDALFIGDNPHKDCIGAHSVGMKCAQVHVSETSTDNLENLPEAHPEFYMDTLFELSNILQEMN